MKEQSRIYLFVMTVVSCSLLVVLILSLYTQPPQPPATADVSMQQLAEEYQSMVDRTQIEYSYPDNVYVATACGFATDNLDTGNRWLVDNPNGDIVFDGKLRMSSQGNFVSAVSDMKFDYSVGGFDNEVKIDSLIGNGMLAYDLTVLDKLTDDFYAHYTVMLFKSSDGYILMATGDHYHDYSHTSNVVELGRVDFPLSLGIAYRPETNSHVLYYRESGGGKAQLLEITLPIGSKVWDKSQLYGQFLVGLVTDATSASATIDSISSDCITGYDYNLPVYRFWSDNFKKHFYTASSREYMKLLGSDENWGFENIAYLSRPMEVCDTNPALQRVYRFYSSVFQAHFYTTSESEKEKLINSDPNWNYENDAFCTYKLDTGIADLVNVYRFYSPVYKAHFYTTRESEKDKLINNDPNWNYEGIAFEAVTP